jgi:uncharacterized membrane protein
MKTEHYMSEFQPAIGVILMIAVTAALACVPGLMFVAWGFPALIFFLEQKSGFVKQKAKHLAAAYMSYAIIQLALAVITLIIYFVSGIIAGLVFFGRLENLWGMAVGEIVMSVLGALVIVAYAVFSIMMAVKTYKNEDFKIPIVFGFAPRAVDALIAKIEEALEKRRAQKKG